MINALLGVGSAAMLLRDLGVGKYGRSITVFALVTISVGVTEAETANVGAREPATQALRPRPPGRHAQGVRLSLTAAGLAFAVAFVVAAAARREGQSTVVAGAGLVLTVAATTVWVPMQVDLRLARVAGLEVLARS